MSRPAVLVFWALPQGPISLSLDTALDVTVMATVSPCWIVKGVQQVRSALAPTVRQPGHHMADQALPQMVLPWDPAA